MNTIKKTFSFCLAHRLPMHEGRCYGVHGHNYEVIVQVAGDLHKEGPERGMVRDFGNLKEIGEFLDKMRDHAYVYAQGDKVGDYLTEQGFKTFCFGVDPTAEEMAKFIYNLFKDLGVISVEVFETPKNSAIYSID